MKSEVIFVKTFKEDKTISDFLDQLREHPTIHRDFLIVRLDDKSLKDEIKEYITENGISSLFSYHITCDAVLHPGITVDETEELILGFIRKLKGVRNLMITDPYLYTGDIASVNLFEKIMLEIAEKIESVSFLINAQTKPKGAEMHGVIKKIAPFAKIKEIVTDKFHDRYWLDLDNKKGIVMGTSLNGIGKKIALIDHLKGADVNELIKLVNAITEPKL